jgi:hypothetical protein
VNKEKNNINKFSVVIAGVSEKKFKYFLTDTEIVSSSLSQLSKCPVQAGHTGYISSTVINMLK